MVMTIMVIIKERKLSHSKLRSKTKSNGFQHSVKQLMITIIIIMGMVLPHGRHHHHEHKEIRYDLRQGLLKDEDKLHHD